VPFDCGVSTIEADDNLGGVGFPINCNCWRCLGCEPRNKRRLRRQIAAGRPNRFITLSCREGAFGDPVIAAAKQRKAWNLVVHRWRRLNPGKTCEYAVVCEEHKNGYPHLHIAWLGGWIDQRWLSEQMEGQMNSPIVDVRAVKGWYGVASYLASYLKKAPHQYGTMKRFWFSQGYPRTKRERKVLHRFNLKDGHRRNHSFAEMLAEWARLGRNVQYMQWGGAAWGHWWATGPPPIRTEPRRLRYVRGFLKYVSKSGITPLEVVGGQRD
jgi:hypothetical protein